MRKSRLVPPGFLDDVAVGSMIAVAGLFLQRLAARREAVVGQESVGSIRIHNEMGGLSTGKF